MLGETTGQELELSEAQRERSFERASLRSRVLVIVAGPIANLFLAALLYAALSWNGLSEPIAKIAAPPANSIAAKSGLVAGDQIASVNDQRTESWNALRLQLFDAALGKEPIFLEIVRNGTPAAVVLDTSQLVTDVLEKDPMGALGFELSGLHVEVSAVVPGSAAERAGLQAGDIVRTVDGDTVLRATILIDHVRARPGYPTRLGIERDGAVMDISVVPDSVTDSATKVVTGRIGASLATRATTVVVHQGFFGGLHAGVMRTVEMTHFSLKMFGRMLAGQLSLRQLSGPVTIADQAGRTAQIGWTAYLAFLALISVSLGTLNLLPLPMLDGGHLVYCAIEAVRGRPLSAQSLNIAQRAGFALIVAMSAVALFNDLVRLFGP
jgi:regulator of sigma E protease